MSRILVHDPRRAFDGGAESLAKKAGHEYVVCRDHEALLTAISKGRPDLLIHVLQDPAHDLEFLSALRRVAPRLPIVIFSDPASLEARRILQDLRPTYYGVLPLDELELRHVVDGALGPDGRPSITRASGV